MVPWDFNARLTIRICGTCLLTQTEFYNQKTSAEVKDSQICVRNDVYTISSSNFLDLFLLLCVIYLFLFKCKDVLKCTVIAWKM